MTDGPIDRLRFGMATAMREPDPRSRARLLDAALEFGIRKFDTAPIYGLGRADKDLAALIHRSGNAAEIEVTTKFGRRMQPGLSWVGRIQRPLRAALRSSSALRGLARKSGGGVLVLPPPQLQELRDELLKRAEMLGIEAFAGLLTHEIPWDSEWTRFYKHLVDERAAVPARRLGFSGARTLLASYPPELFGAARVLQFPLSDPVVTTSPERSDVIYAALSTLGDWVNAQHHGGEYSEWLQDLEREGETYPFLLALTLRLWPRSDVVIGTSSRKHLQQLVKGATAWLAADVDWSRFSSSMRWAAGDR